MAYALRNDEEVIGYTDGLGRGNGEPGRGKKKKKKNQGDREARRGPNKGG